MGYSQVLAPTLETLTLDEAREHLRIVTTDDDVLLSFLIGATTEYIENITRRVMLPQQWELSLDAFPSDLIRLEVTPITSVNSIQYINPAGILVTLPPSDYVVDLKNVHPRIVPAYRKSWPATQPIINAVTVNFTVGYANPTLVPKLLRAAQKLLLAAFYEHREAIMAGVPISDLPKPMAVESILWQHRVWSA